MTTTATLAAFAAEARWSDLPPAARHAARRTVANAIGLAVGAADHPVVEIADHSLRALTASGTARVLGRAQTTSAPGSALLHGIAMHVEDFDDTHLRTVLHPGAPTTAAALAAGQLRERSGADLLAAVAVGVEVASRIGNGVCPAHFDRGWHVTGTIGHLGAAATSAALLALDTTTTAQALALAADQAAGTTEQLGSMTKPLHPGKAAADGLSSALLAEAGITGPPRPLNGENGLGGLLSDGLDSAAVLTGIGTTWELADNAFKPYSCGIVSHPVIDAAIAMRDRIGDPARIRRVTAVVRPVVLDVMGVKEPKDGLQSKFSVYHCFAVGLLDGCAGPAQYTDARATDEQVVRVRSTVTAVLDPEMAKDACRVEVELDDGNVLSHQVEHAVGSVDRPMSDDQLREKFLLLTTPRLGHRAAAAWDVTWALDELPRLHALFEAVGAGA